MARDQDKSKEELLLELASLRAELAALKTVEHEGHHRRQDNPAGFIAPESSEGQKPDNLPDNGLPADHGQDENQPLVLVVEDDPVMNELLVMLLGRKYRVATAFEGQTGLEKALALSPDLIMIDIMMPGMSGDQLVTELRYRPVFDEVPLIVLTAKADDQLRLSLLSSNVQAYLNKPFETEEVQLWVDNLLSQRLRLLEERRERDVRLRSHVENSPLAVIETDADFRVIYWSPQAEEMFGWRAAEVLDKKPEEWRFIYEEDLEQFIRRRESLFKGETIRQASTNRNTHKDGSILHCQWYHSVLQDATGRPISMLSLAHDITRQKQIEAELRLRVRQQAVVARLGLLALEIDLAAFKDQVVQQVAETLQVEYVKVLKLLPSGASMRLVAGVGWQEGLVGRAVIGTDLDSQAGYTLFSKQPVIVQDLGRESRFSGPSLLVEHGVVSGLSVIIGESQNPYGVLGAHTRQPRTFTANDINFLQAVANVLAQAVNHHQSQEALRVSEQRYRTLTESAPVLIWEAGTDKLVDYFNQNWLKFTGRELQQEVGYGWTEGVHPEDHRYCIKTYIEAFEARQPFQMEYRLRRYDGVYRHMLDHGVPRYDARGQFEGYIGSCIDITERKEAEKRQVDLLAQIKEAQAQAEAERQHLHRLFMQAPAMIGMHQGPEHIFTFANTLVQELSGNRPLIGKSIREAFSELQGPDFFESYDRVYHSRQPYIIRETHLIYDRDGDSKLEEGYFDEILQPILRADGSVEGVMFFAFEVTDQVRARQLLQETNELLEARVIERTQELQTVNEQLLQALEIRQETEELLDSVLNSSPDGVVALDPVRDEAGRIIDFKWILANTRAAAINHLSVEEMLGAYLLAVTPTLVRSGLFDHYVHVAETGHPFRTEIFYDYEHLRGWFDLTVVKRGAGIALTIREITQQKADQEAIRHLNHILARRAAELERANEELKEFSYSISHDLRAPLRAISGFTQIIDRRYRDNLNEEGRHYLDNIIAASNHMAQLIDDLLIYSRMGREPVDQELVNLADIMAQIEENYLGHIETTRATLHRPPELPLVRGDRTLLSRLFTNLVDNALKYHRPDVPPELHVGYRIEDGSVIVSVQDNGLGIPAEHYRRIFNLFQRLHTLEEYPGTGLGLAIVKRSVQLMGGDVWLDSTPGEGSIFYIKLPLA